MVRELEFSGGTAGQDKLEIPFQAVIEKPAGTGYSARKLAADTGRKHLLLLWRISFLIHQKQSHSKATVGFFLSSTDGKTTGEASVCKG